MICSLLSLLDLVEVASVGVERVVGFFGGPVVGHGGVARFLSEASDKVAGYSGTPTAIGGTMNSISF